MMKISLVCSLLLILLCLEYLVDVLQLYLKIQPVMYDLLVQSTIHDATIYMSIKNENWIEEEYNKKKGMQILYKSKVWL